MRTALLHSFSTQSCRWLLLLVALMAAPYLAAQVKNITVTVYRTDNPQEKGQPWNNQKVYGFFGSAKARKFKTVVDKAKNSGETAYIDNEYFDVGETTDDNGNCMLQLPLSGVIIVWPEEGDLKEVAVAGRLQLEVSVLAAKTLKGVTKTVTVDGPTIVPPASQCGNRITFGPFAYNLDSAVTNSKARMMICPVVKTFTTGDDLDTFDKIVITDTVGYLYPIVKDGVDFQKANERFWGMDETNDPMFVYRTRGLMRSYSRDSVLVQYALEPVDINRHYRVDAIMAWAENNKKPYRVDSICLNEGYNIDPMRFLDYDLIDVPIKRTDYVRKGVASFTKAHEKLDLKFLSGRAELDANDTASTQQLVRLKQNLLRYTGADGGITAAVIHGSASPEGGMAINERLCRERAAFLAEELGRSPALQEARAPGGGGVKSTHKVATWGDVANLLLADSLTAEAEAVQQVVMMIPDMQRQEAEIRKLPCWALIEEQILPRLRVVDVEYQYYTNRVRSAKEIWDLYQTDAEYRAGRKQKPYEFYELLGRITDPEELERMAQAAYYGVKEPDGERPYAYAAYLWARCKAERGEIDTTMLKPYLDFKRAGMKTKKYMRTDFETNSRVGIMNDPAIVAMQIKMYVLAKAYGAAYVTAESLLPDSAQYRRQRLFLRCLNCEWNDPEVMDTVSASSLWNNIVVKAAQPNRADKETALYLLGSESLRQNEPRLLYLKAQLLFQLYPPQHSTEGYNPVNVFSVDEYFEPSSSDPYRDSYGETRSDCGVPMLQCCLLDERFIKTMLFDGVFNQDYRKAFVKYWKMLKNGEVEMPDMPAEHAVTQDDAGVPPAVEEPTDDEEDEEGFE